MGFLIQNHNWLNIDDYLNMSSIYLYLASILPWPSHWIQQRKDYKEDSSINVMASLFLWLTSRWAVYQFRDDYFIIYVAMTST
jgi:ABC-type Mn2+/Zn2+ transport system permease subunit